MCRLHIKQLQCLLSAVRMRAVCMCAAYICAAYKSSKPYLYAGHMQYASSKFMCCICAVGKVPAHPCIRAAYVLVAARKHFLYFTGFKVIKVQKNNDMVYSLIVFQSFCLHLLQDPQQTLFTTVLNSSLLCGYSSFINPAIRNYYKYL